VEKTDPRVAGGVFRRRTITQTANTTMATGHAGQRAQLAKPWWAPKRSSRPPRLRQVAKAPAACQRDLDDSRSAKASAWYRQAQRGAPGSMPRFPPRRSPRNPGTWWLDGAAWPSALRARSGLPISRPLRSRSLPQPLGARVCRNHFHLIESAMRELPGVGGLRVRPLDGTFSA